MTNDKTISDDLKAQRAYSQRVAEEGFDFGLTVADAFVRGIRDIGYRDTATAFDEHLDNGIQAEATKMLIAFGFEGDSDAKPTSIAVVDNGHGMDPDMVRLSAIWGGTHRENDRHGFGRYGYGLPSAAVSQGKRFSVYSRPEGGDWHAVTLDLDEVTEGVHTTNGKITMPEARSAKLPAWLEAQIGDWFDGPLDHGTVVLMEKLDRLSWKTKSALERHLLEHIGVTYRNFLRGTEIRVDEKQVEVIDPLFITPGYRFYDLDEDRAEPLDPHTFDVRDKGSREPLGTVKVRYSFLPPTFARVDKTVERGKNNARFPTMRAHNGIIVLREGRQIDVVTKPGRLSVNNDDRYWNVELDVPATLDEEMSITTSKQRVILSDRMWDLLEQEGVMANIKALRARYDEEKARLKTKRKDEEDRQRESEQAMEASEKYKPTKTPDTPERRKRTETAFEREVERRSDQSGLPREAVESQLEAEAQGRKYRVVEEDLAGAPFFSVEQVGPQKVLRLNTRHRFFKDLYAGPESTDRLRAAIEVLLFSIGTAEVDAEGDRRTFYETERNTWSITLNAALSELEKIDPPEEVRATDEEERELLAEPSD